MWLKKKALRPGLRGQRRAKFWEDHLLRTERGSFQETMGMLSPLQRWETICESKTTLTRRKESLVSRSVGWGALSAGRWAWDGIWRPRAELTVSGLRSPVQPNEKTDQIP